MIYGEIAKMKNNLDQVNFIEDADQKFVYAVSKNKEKCEQIIKSMNKLVDPSEKITEFREKADKINQKYAQKDPDGTVGYVNHPQYGRAYRKIVGDGNPDSDHGREMKALEDTYAKYIKEHEGKVKIFEKHLDEEVSGDDNRWRKISEDLIPDGLHPKGMDGCLSFIIEKEEPKIDEVPVKELKKK